MRRPSTGRTSPRTISRAMRPRIGCRCAPDSFYSENGIDLRLRTDVTEIDAALARGRARRRQQDPLRPAAARNRRRARPPVDPRRRSATCSHAALARRLPGHHRARQDGAPGGRDRRELYRARGRGRPARARDSRSMWWRRKSGRWSAFWARRWATSCARCTRSTASSSISKTRRRASMASR